MIELCGWTLLVPTVLVLTRQIVPLIFEVPMNPAFNLNDALTVSVLSEQCFMLVEAGKKYPQALPAFLAQNILPALNCPPDFTATFLGSLGNAQPLKQYLRGFFLGTFVAMSMDVMAGFIVVYFDVNMFYFFF